jgi:hypothetical protein
LVPAHLQALHAHQSRFGLREGAKCRSSQIENHETHTDNIRIYLAAQRGLHSGPTSLHHHACPFLIKPYQGQQIPHAGHQCVRNMTSYL